MQTHNHNTPAQMPRKQLFSDASCGCTSRHSVYNVVQHVSLANRFFMNIHKHRVGLRMPCALFLQLNHSRLKHDCHNIHNVENPSLKSWWNIHEFTYPERGPANSCTHEQQTEIQSFLRLITPLFCLSYQLFVSVWQPVGPFRGALSYISCIDLLTLHSSITRLGERFR